MNNNKASIKFEYDQIVYVLITGEGEQSGLPIKDGNLVVFELLFHAAPLADELMEQGICAQVVPVAIGILYYLTDRHQIGLWVTRYDGTVAAIDGVA